MARHKLTEKNLTTMTAQCSVDGLVGLRRAGKSVRCEVANKAAQKAWVEANPEKARENRRIKSDHMLRDRTAGHATCSICGPVDTIPWGRGVACGNRARQLRVKQQVKTIGACSECWATDSKRVWTRADGTCPRCSTLEDLRWAYLPAERRDPGFRFTHSMMALGAYVYEDDVPDDDAPDYGIGYSVTNDNADPALIAEYESAVPGWKTIGSNEPWSEVA